MRAVGSRGGDRKIAKYAASWGFKVVLPTETQA